MSKELETIQQRLMEAGFNIGRAGADGLWGHDTAAALLALFDKIGLPYPQKVLADAHDMGPLVHAATGVVKVPEIWLPVAKMSRVICHWTAGSYTCSELDVEHYHLIIDGDLKLHKGEHSIKDNEANLKEGSYAAHTLNCNTGSIGVSIAAMAGAVESPFNAGKFPMKEEQFDALAQVVAQLCTRYSIPVSRKTVLSHAEVQPTLGITQRGKWDYSRLPFKPDVVGAVAVGDYLRSQVEEYMR